MKKSAQDKIFYKKNISEKFKVNEKAKTTNINILLNRVKLDRKRDLKKKMIFFTIIVFIISLLVTFFIV